ncbi:MAG TPA: efflux transporter outer membrane subunit, partial [Steroidobacteraceae bacterium]|nr:efflux transporter outer membrane subunit [Steroidobacteraceae bacterium]
MTRSARRLSLTVLAAAVVSACAVGPDFHAPAPPATTHYTRAPEPTGTVAAPGASGTAQTFSTERDIPADWWTLFHSQPLDELVRQALTDSPSVQAAQATLLTAVETWKAERGGLLLPAVDAQGLAERQREPGAVVGEPQIPGLIFNLFDASVGVTYRLDLFGASRRQVEALRAQAQYQRWEFEAARLALTANVITTAVNIASLHAQTSALADIIASERDQLQVVQRQFDAGAASRSDVLAQQTQVADNEAQLPALEKQLAQAQHRLAVLVGRTPDDATVPDFTLDQLTLPAELPLSVPSKLVRQRPDVQAAEALLHQSTAQLGVATANMYPQLNLTGSIGSETVQASELFKTGSAAWNIGGSLTQPLFHGGALVARKHQYQASYEAAVAQYRQTVLSAFENVADTLVSLEEDASTLEQAHRAARAAAAMSRDTTSRYQLGSTQFYA